MRAAADRTSAAAVQTIETSKGTAEVIINQGAAFLVEQFREKEAKPARLVLKQKIASLDDAVRSESQSRLAGVAGRVRHALAFQEENHGWLTRAAHDRD